VSVSELDGKKELKVRIRLDFKGRARPGRFLFGGKPVDKVAEEIREQQVSLFRNIPIQGIRIDDIDVSTDVYTIRDDYTNSEIAYAPVILTLTAENLVDLLHFIAREEFRKIEILEPGHQYLTKYDIERLLFRIHEEFNSYIEHMEKKFKVRQV